MEGTSGLASVLAGWRASAAGKEPLPKSATLLYMATLYMPYTEASRQVKKMTKSFASLGNEKTLKFFRPAPIEATSRRATVPAGNGAWQAGQGEKVKKMTKSFPS